MKGVKSVADMGLCLPAGVKLHGRLTQNQTAKACVVCMHVRANHLACHLPKSSGGLMQNAITCRLQLSAGWRMPVGTVKLLCPAMLLLLLLLLANLAVIVSNSTNTRPAMVKLPEHCCCFAMQSHSDMLLNSCTPLSPQWKKANKISSLKSGWEACHPPRTQSACRKMAAFPSLQQQQKQQVMMYK